MAGDGSLQVEQQPMPSVNQPSSGTYGEGVALQRLQDALPPMQPPAPTQNPNLPPVTAEPVRALPPQREGRPPTGAALPPGVPSPILAPSDNPAQPVNTPLSGATPAMQPTSMQSRLAILDALAESPNVSDETRKWAQMVRSVLIGA